MALRVSNPKLFFQFLVTLVTLSSATKFVSGNFYQLVDIIWGGQNVQYQDGGDVLALSMDTISGSGFVSKHEYLFGRITMQMKLVSGNSAGTVTTFYLASSGVSHDEVDFEFLGNQSGNPYVLHTNIFAQGKGDREMQFNLWFDPTADFHNYTLIWNPLNLIFLVDDVPLRVFRNRLEDGVGFPHDQPMRVYCSLWDAEEWATEGGRVKTDWTLVPFTAYYKGFDTDACYPAYDYSKCQWSSAWSPWYNQELDNGQIWNLKWVNDNLKIYDYCEDTKRFPDGLPKECTLP
ncbi:hypothetical protein LUZ63_006515 [Rhynchospora breviuscula]|uniref:Xyloglucan endotransglucosylase/hydrolase n=1 Tax=Rhynchospora breviuscula TaxID=2022672 RepID=A0A9Q0CPY8_9POAL|nr:hypothetical protein LUZ63_006515 [Rhynchospora breviuscula]